ncbi:MAG: histidinol dehydrogenase [Deltaproteobacteria bacterium]|nr:histidinol dehydrogenase [Deltaproteobacteria bacterium]
MAELIPILSTAEPDFERRFAVIRQRSAVASPAVEEQARRIVADVRRRGDRALIEYTRRYDGVRLSPEELEVDPDEMTAATRSLRPAELRALKLAARRIEAFHRRQVQRSWRYRDRAGLTLGQRVIPLRRVGVYVPGGHGSYPSSVLMNAIPALVAGVNEVIMVSPVTAAGYSPAVLAAADIVGVSAMFRVGGAQAVAALAYGTERVPAVDKIVGPGNAWVQAAKRQVYGHVDIDKIAGPSEIVVITDGSVPPSYAAADLLAQAEHGSGEECAVLLTPSRAVAEAVRAAIAVQLQSLPRRAAIARVLRRRGALVVVRGMIEAVGLAEQIAPEHLELLVADAGRWPNSIRNAGAIFVGPHSCAPLGDYAAGPNHVLPTGGTARFSSPLGVYDFVKRTSVVRASPRALRTLAPAITTLAELEGYQAHAAAVRVRLKGGR